VLKPGGRIAYFNIFVTDDLPERERSRVGKDLPAGVYTRVAQRELLEAAGFAAIQETDVTREFRRTAKALFEANARHERSLRRDLGDGPFEEAQAGRLRTVRNIERGVVRRSLLVARRPPARRAARPPGSAG
jgi:hypothetical protein